MIADLHIKLPRKTYGDLPEVKVDTGTESCVLPLRALKKKFPSNLTTDGLPKPDAL